MMGNQTLLAIHLGLLGKGDEQAKAVSARNVSDTINGIPLNKGSDMPDADSSCCGSRKSSTSQSQKRAN